MSFSIVKKISDRRLFKLYQIKDDKNNLFLMKKAKDSKKEESINMIKNEKVSLSTLEKTGICPKVYEAKEDDVLIEEYIEGKSLENYVFKNDKEMQEILLKLLNNVKTIHSFNIIHCDLKPDNIIIDKNNNVRIIDFGISKNSEEYLFNGYGNHKYCSKETAFHETPTYKADIYSLGIIIYEILFKFLPFTGDKNEVLRKKKNDLYEITCVNKYDTFFRKCFDINEGYTNIDEMINDFNTFNF